MLTGEPSGIHTWKWKNGNVGCHISQQSQTGGRQGPVLSSNRGDRRSQVKLDKQRFPFLTWLWVWGHLGLFSKDLWFLYHKGIYKLLQMYDIIAKRVDYTIVVEEVVTGRLACFDSNASIRGIQRVSVCVCLCACVCAVRSREMSVCHVRSTGCKGSESCWSKKGHFAESEH